MQVCVNFTISQSISILVSFHHWHYILQIYISRLISIGNNQQNTWC